jgi:hypothetical protein
MKNARQRWRGRRLLVSSSIVASGKGWKLTDENCNLGGLLHGDYAV